MASIHFSFNPRESEHYTGCIQKMQHLGISCISQCWEGMTELAEISKETESKQCGAKMGPIDHLF
jgi:hypothetical protein